MSKRLAPGVVTGADYFALVDACKAGGFALPAVNVTSTHTINAALEAAAKSRSDIIIQLSNGGAQFFAGKGLADPLQAKILGAVSAAQHVHLLAEHYGVCVVLNTDHANRPLIPWVDGMIDHSQTAFEKTGRPLFSSHMLDLSSETLDFNLNECARVLDRLAPLGMGLEMELGITGGEEDGVGSDVDGASDELYTSPEHVLRAYERLHPIGRFSIAAAFGNVHGVYKPGNVVLRPEILAHCQSLVRERHATGANPLDLVFHGGSGSPKQTIVDAIGFGVFKMNIDTDTQFAFARAVGSYVAANPRAFEYQLDPDDGRPYKKIYDPRKWLRVAEQSMVERLGEACADLGSAGNTCS